MEGLARGRSLEEKCARSSLEVVGPPSRSRRRRPATNPEERGLACYVMTYTRVLMKLAR